MRISRRASSAGWNEPSRGWRVPQRGYVWREGSGLNALLVSALEREREVFVQPAAGNAGTAIGAVLWVWHTIFRESTRVDLGNMCLGPQFTAEQVKQVLENCKLRFRYLITSDEAVELAVRQLSENRDCRVDARANGVRTTRAG